MNKKGFSLIELMIALVVGLIATTAVYSFLISSLNIFSAQEEVSQVQFNAQGALRFINDTFKNAGSGVVAKVPLPAIDFLNNASSTDSSTYLTGTDAIQIRSYGNIGAIMSVKDYHGSAKNVTIDARTSYIDPNPINNNNTSVGNLLLIWKDGIDNYSLVEITHVSTTWSHSLEQHKVNFSPGLSIYNTPTGLNENYSGGKAIMIDKNSMLTTTFFVDTNNVLRIVNGYYNLNNPSDPNNQPALPFLDNVEDFQLQLGFDTSGTEKRDVDTWEFNVTKPLEQCIAIKCYILLKGNSEDKNLSNVKRIDIDPDDGITYTNAKDNIRRRLYSFTVQLRNRLTI